MALTRVAGCLLLPPSFVQQLSDDEYDGASVSVDDRGGKIVHDPIHGSAEKSDHSSTTS